MADPQSHTDRRVKALRQRAMDAQVIYDQARKAGASTARLIDLYEAVMSTRSAWRMAADLRAIASFLEKPGPTAPSGARLATK